MPAPYSYDLRRKAVEAIKRGHKKVNVSGLFKISRNTLDIWLKREKETGDFQRSTNKQGRHSQIEDQEKFKSFVKENKDQTQTKMAELWGNNITQQNISYTCQKLGITRKKKLTDTRKEMKHNEKLSGKKSQKLRRKEEFM
ncbi:MAG: IS630 transposase-related protein [Trichodesmium sp. MO_231.B1]|nr:IS630 transposase-related protein [Trichodesmium sp. MO_231.B1]